MRTCTNEEPPSTLEATNRLSKSCSSAKLYLQLRPIWSEDRSCLICEEIACMYKFSAFFSDCCCCCCSFVETGRSRLLLCLELECNRVWLICRGDCHNATFTTLLHFLRRKNTLRRPPWSRIVYEREARTQSSNSRENKTLFLRRRTMQCSFEQIQCASHLFVCPFVNHSFVVVADILFSSSLRILNRPKWSLVVRSIMSSNRLTVKIRLIEMNSTKLSTMNVGWKNLQKRTVWERICSRSS